MMDLQEYESRIINKLFRAAYKMTKHSAFTNDFIAAQEAIAITQELYDSRDIRAALVAGKLNPKVFIAAFGGKSKPENLTPWEKAAIAWLTTARKFIAKELRP